MRGNKLTNEQRDQIIGAYLAGSNAPKILAALSIACTTVYETINRYKKTGSPYPKKRSGRSKVLSSRDQRPLQRIVLKDRFSSFNKVTNELNLNFNTTYHLNTIRNYLHNLGLRAKRSWNKEWKRIVWSDESRFALFRSDGCAK
ncbi:10228_t:CDS:2, partial [Dentiscutata erythropus]